MKQQSKKRARPWGQKRSKAEKLARKNKRQARIESAPYQLNWQCGPGVIGSAAAREAGDVPGHHCGWVDNPRGLVRNTRRKTNRKVHPPKRLYQFAVHCGSGYPWMVQAPSFGAAASEVLGKLIGKLKYLKRRPGYDGMGGWTGISLACLTQVKRPSPFCSECGNHKQFHKLDCSEGGASWTDRDYLDQAA